MKTLVKWFHCDAKHRATVSGGDRIDGISVTFATTAPKAQFKTEVSIGALGKQHCFVPSSSFITGRPQCSGDSARDWRQYYLENLPYIVAVFISLCYKAYSVLYPKTQKYLFIFE